MTVTHDKVFKTFLNDVQTARDFLSIYLPKRLLQLCDLTTLHLETNSFLDPELRAHYSDIVYSVEVTDRPGKQKAYVYSLIEHQSTPDRWIAFRQMRYAISIMYNHISQGNDYLPLVIPMLFYHGTVSPYPYSTNWFDLFDAGQREVAQSLYTQPFPLIDVTVIPDDEILTHKRIALLELLQKNIRQRDMMVLADKLAFLIQLFSGTDEQLEVLLRYMLEVGDTAEPDRLLQMLAVGSPEHKEVVMTVAQKLEERARKEGHREGHREGKLELARKMLRIGVSLEDLKREAGLTDEEIKQLRH